MRIGCEFDLTQIGLDIRSFIAHFLLRWSSYIRMFCGVYGGVLGADSAGLRSRDVAVRTTEL